MEKGNTFLEAAKYLFDKANVEYSFGEKDVKTRRSYRYPHEEPLNGKTNVLEYWGKRGISKNVIVILTSEKTYMEMEYLISMTQMMF